MNSEQSNPTVHMKHEGECFPIGTKLPGTEETVVGYYTGTGFTNEMYTASAPDELGIQAMHHYQYDYCIRAEHGNCIVVWDRETANLALCDAVHDAFKKGGIQ